MNKSLYKRIAVRFVVVLLSIVTLFASFYIIDFNRVDNEEPPIFAIPILYLKDGGTVYKIGFGYGVFEWSKMTTIVENGIEVNGNLVGYEFVKYPGCYSVITDKKREPKVRLIFKK
jgi:hypothetical protein